MKRVKLVNCPSIEKVREILAKAYGLRSGDYVMTELPPEHIITINDEFKPKDAQILVTSDPRAYKGFLSCYPPLGEAKTYTYEEIKQFITEEGVNVNLDEQAVKDCYARFADSEIVINALIAQGIEPTDGHNAEIIIHFSVPENRPKVVDGKSDFKNIDNIIMVKKGDLLLTKKLATSGSKGITVRGEEVSPIQGKDITILLGDGATVDEKGISFTATLDGYVDYNGKKLTVSPLYEVKGDVDYSTGNIKFNGSVHIRGDVLPGFKVEADKHILVDGICQDCELIARENVILRTGIKGSGGGTIIAGGSVIVGYCEKSKIQAKENIEIKKYAFNCDIMAGNRVEALAGEGIIAGGSISAFQEITAKQMGTMGNSAFSVAVGSRYYIEHELGRLRKEKIKIGETLLQVDVALSRFDLEQEKIRNHPKIKKMVEVKTKLDTLIKELDEREQKLNIENKARSPRIKVKGRVFEGLTVSFYGVNTTIKEQLESIVFYYDDKFGEVSWVSMKNISSIELHDQ